MALSNCRASTYAFASATRLACVADFANAASSCGIASGYWRDAIMSCAICRLRRGVVRELAIDRDRLFGLPVLLVKRGELQQVFAYFGIELRRLPEVRRRVGEFRPAAPAPGRALIREAADLRIQLQRPAITRLGRVEGARLQAALRPGRSADETRRASARRRASTAAARPPGFSAEAAGCRRSVRLRIEPGFSSSVFRYSATPSASFPRKL